MKRKNIIIDWLASNLAFGALSLVLAVLAWTFVNGGRQTEQRRTVKIQYLQPPRGLAFHRTPLKEFKIDMAGSLFKLRMIKDEDLVYPVDLSSVNAGALRVDIDLDNLRLPMEIEASHPSPRSFMLYLEELATHGAPLKPIVLGAPKEGFVVGEIHLSPSTVMVAGPRSLISKIGQIEIEIPVGDRDSSFSTSIKPRVTLPDVEVQDSVVAEVEIKPIRIVRELMDIPVVTDGRATNVKINPGVARVFLEGDSNSALELEGKLKVVIATEDLKRGRYRLRGEVALPPGVRLVRIEPATFLVEIGQR